MKNYRLALYLGLAVASPMAVAQKKDKDTVKVNKEKTDKAETSSSKKTKKN